jgi:Rnl2 family RNA ligase
MSFVEYPSIENSYNQKAIKKVCDNVQLREKEWVAVEKIHGCNYSFIIDQGGELKAARRSAILLADENFYNHAEVFDRYADAIRQLWAICQVEIPDLVEIQVFGEMFGGYYPDPTDPKQRKTTPIQVEVLYSKKKEFFPFDLKIKLESGEIRYLSFDQAEKYFHLVGFQTPKIIARGSLEGVLMTDPVFLSPIPIEAGLSGVQENYAEGLVIRPIESIFMHDGIRCQCQAIPGASCNGKRIIFKNKHPKFSERHVAKPIIPSTSAPPTEKLVALMVEAEQYITEARLVNLHSKLTEQELKNRPKVKGLYIQDLWKEVMTILPEEEPLTEKETKMLKEHLAMKVSERLRL